MATGRRVWYYSGRGRYARIIFIPVRGIRLLSGGRRCAGREEHMTHERISQRVAVVPPSGIRRFFDIAAQMPDVISLGIGEPDFVTPTAIRAAAVRSLDEGHTAYTSN